MWSQDVHEGGRGVARCCWGVDGPSAAQSRGQAERSRWCSSVETLLLKRLQEEKWNKRRLKWSATLPVPSTFQEKVARIRNYLRLCVNRPWNIWNTCVAWCHRDSCRDRKDKSSNSWVKSLTAHTSASCFSPYSLGQNGLKKKKDEKWDGERERALKDCVRLKQV